MLDGLSFKEIFVHLLDLAPHMACSSKLDKLEDLVKKLLLSWNTVLYLNMKMLLCLLNHLIILLCDFLLRFAGIFKAYEHQPSTSGHFSSLADIYFYVLYASCDHFLCTWQAFLILSKTNHLLDSRSLVQSRYF